MLFLKDKYFESRSGNSENNYYYATTANTVQITVQIYSDIVQ